jgi:hypothetical protein
MSFLWRQVLLSGLNEVELAGVQFVSTTGIVAPFDSWKTQRLVCGNSFGESGRSISTSQTAKHRSILTSAALDDAKSICGANAESYAAFRESGVNIFVHCLGRRRMIPSAFCGIYSYLGSKSHPKFGPSKRTIRYHAVLVYISGFLVVGGYQRGRTVEAIDRGDLRKSN